ncbi:hypothetical protein KW791_01925 [Candidatus Parcubacteria bacterium]|nr:hypothetical protein [Candidatus Parcubacteria bacterium]
MKKIIIVIALLAIAGAGYWYWSNMKIQQESSNVSETWKTYSSPDNGFSIKYDPSLTPEAEDGQVRFYKWGPTQKGETELYDGMAVSIQSMTLTGSLEDFANEEMAQFARVGEITKDLHDVKINGVSAKSYSASGLGDFTVYLVPVNSKKILYIATLAPDPGNLGFQKTIDDMLSTFVLVK